MQSYQSLPPCHPQARSDLRCLPPHRVLIRPPAKLCLLRACRSALGLISRRPNAFPRLQWPRVLGSWLRGEGPQPARCCRCIPPLKGSCSRAARLNSLAAADSRQGSNSCVGNGKNHPLSAIARGKADGADEASRFVCLLVSLSVAVAQIRGSLLASRFARDWRSESPEISYLSAATTQHIVMRFRTHLTARLRPEGPLRPLTGSIYVRTPN